MISGIVMGRNNGVARIFGFMDFGEEEVCEGSGIRILRREMSWEE